MHIHYMHIHLDVYLNVHLNAAWASFANLAAALKNKLGKDVSHALKAQVVCVRGLCACACACACALVICFDLSTPKLCACVRVRVHHLV